MNFEPYLTKIRKIVRKANRGIDWDWTSGGCFAFALAFVKTFGGKEFGLCEFDEDVKDYPVHHAIVKYRGKFYDAKGEVDMEYWNGQIKGMVVKSKEDGDIVWFDDYFLRDNEVAELENILTSLKPAFQDFLKVKQAKRKTKEKI